MKYRTDRYGNELSQLGYGCMRFTTKGGNIDYEKAEREILRAIDKGINYFDTAYMYSGSEVCLGRILDENNCRDKVKIATKLPQYMLRSAKAIDKTFREELSRLRTDHVDYYLMHMFTDLSEWERLKGYGIEKWIADRKAEGSIGQIGFSYHGDTEMFLKILDAYDWDFCQIQYNYLDENSQAGRRGLQAAAAKGLPVIIMEPLRGGKLVNLPEKAMNELRASGKGYSSAELGLRWLWDQPEVTVVLSGMNSLEMVDENTRIASDAEPGKFDASDQALIQSVRNIFKEKEKVGCTGCRYCMPCPQGVDIPGNFHYYNLMYIEGKKTAVRFEFARNVGLQKEPGFASQCVGCGKCELHCPQHIHIREMLKKADRALRPIPYKAGIAIARKALSR
ncbi:MAG: aldo/keto reductase [Mogibacterium sp.]|nr:aldo/keto reductase [Mogibacterium sp.]